MALSHVTRLFGVVQCKISPVTADTSGNATTYGSSVLIPGVKNVKLTGSVKTEDLRGDNTYLDSDSVLEGLEVELDYARLSFDVVSTLLGGSVTDSGTTPNQLASWTLASAPSFGYVKIEARTTMVDLASGDYHILIGKAKLADFPDGLGLVEEGYSINNLKFKAVPPLGTGASWLKVSLNETAATIS